MAVISFVVILVLFYRLSASYSVPEIVIFDHGDPLGLLCQPKSPEFTRLWDVLCVNRNSLSFRMFVLLLCGDVELNPGDLDFCPFCGSSVSDSDRAMCCDSCDRWVHVSCDPSISVAEYDVLVSNPSSTPWFCSLCDGADSGDGAESDEAVQPGMFYCACLNARGIVSKQLDLMAYLSVHHLDILGVTESFLDFDVLDSEVCPAGFVIFRRDWDRHGGGVVALVRDNLVVHRRPDLESSCELLWLELLTKKGPLLFGIYYRPPRSDLFALHELHNSLQLLSAGSKVILCGDFNAPHIDWSSVLPVKSSPVNTRLCSIANDNFLTQLVSVPTRHDHILDLVFSNYPSVLSAVSVVDNLLGTDHEALQFVVTLPSCSTSRCWRLLYNYAKADFQLFRDTLSHVPWDSVIDYDSDIDSVWSQWHDLFLSVADSCIPRVRWRQRKMKHWFTDHTLRLIRQKRRVYRSLLLSPNDHLHNKYSKLSNLVRASTRKDTQDYVQAISGSYFTAPKVFWSFVNRARAFRSPLPAINVNDTLVHDDLMKANIFNTYFGSVFTNEDVSNLEDLRSSSTEHPLLIDSVEVLVSEVCDLLRDLDSRKACGPDLLPARLLKERAEEISSSLCKIFNLSLSKGVLPQDWTSAHIVPVHKKNDRSNPSNYRPISLTSIVIKVLEKLVHRKVASALESHGLLSDFQHGFRAGRSTVGLLSEAVQAWALALEQRRSVHSLFLDLAKVFNSG